MYCINCGVKLADTEKRCPLCGTIPYHPDLVRPAAERLYPEGRYPSARANHRLALLAFSMVFLMPLLITLLCDLQLNGGITWSGYAIGALLLGYIILLLPRWFRRRNPIIFVPCDFVAAGLYLLYINLATGGNWFLSFAFPVTGFFGLVVTAVLTLTRCLRRGYLYIFGGAAIAVGVFMPVMELLLVLTFDLPRFVAWSLYPMTALVLLGGLLIFLAICRPARESMERKLFL